MRRILIAAVKGGTGKTTTAIHLAHALALAGREVLLVDCDLRRHASLHFGLEPAPGLAEWLAGERVPATVVRPGLRIVQSGGEALAHSANERDCAARLRVRLELVRDADFVLFDAPPDGGALQAALLAVATDVLVPVPRDRFALQAAAELCDGLGANRAGDAPRFLGVLATLDEPDTASGERFAALRDAMFPHEVCATRIRCCEALRQASLANGTVFDTDPWARGALDYVRLAIEIESESLGIVHPATESVADRGAPGDGCEGDSASDRHAA